MSSVLSKHDQAVHRLFDYGIIVKGIDGIAELIGAVLLAVISADQLNHWVAFITQRELRVDPTDIVANYLIRTGFHITAASEWFGMLYLAIHGIVKVLVVVLLLRQKIWAYPMAIVIFILFIIFQIVSLINSPGWGIGFITVFDVAIVYLTWLEYRRVGKLKTR